MAWVAIILAWPPASLTLTVDDSFYYFQIAKHVATGDGITFDGIQETTGFHPLWLVFLVPFGRLFDSHPDAAVRIVLLLQLGMTAWSAIVLGRTTSGRDGRAIAVFAIFALVFNFVKAFVNGLESALELLFLALALVEAERASNRRRFAVLGALCGLLCLARLSALPGAAMLVAVALRRRKAPRASGIQAGAFLLLPIAVYACFLYARTGHAVPVSAAIKYGSGIWGWPPTLRGAAACIAALFALTLSARAELAQRNWPIWVLPLLTWITVQLVFDVVVRKMIVPEIWYLVPHATFAVLATSEVLRHRNWLRPLCATIAVFAAAVWYARIQPETYSFYAEAEKAGIWLSRNTPKESRIAGWDSGIEAHYSQRRLANLDGLASSWNYKSNYLDRGRSRTFLDDAGIDYVAQAAPEPLSVSQYCDVDLGDWEVVYEEPFSFRGITMWFEGPMKYRYFILRRRSAL